MPISTTNQHMVKVLGSFRLLAYTGPLTSLFLSVAGTVGQYKALQLYWDPLPYPVARIVVDLQAIDD